MAKAARKALDENGNIVEIESPVAESTETVPVQKVKREPTEYIFQLTNKVYHSAPNRPPYPENVFIRNTDVIYDEESGTERNIRYLEGVGTIFEDEQEHLSESKKKQKPEIRFVRGILRVPSNKTSLLKFLMSSNMFDKKKKRMDHILPLYTILNFEEQEQKEINDAEIRMDAMKMAMDAPSDILVPHCQYLGIRLKNQYGEERSEKGLRVDYLNFADKNPDTFIKTYNNPLVKIEFAIKNAVTLNLINLNSVKGQAIWGDTKKFIAQIPDRKDPVKHLSEFALSDAGKEFYSQLKSMTA